MLDGRATVGVGVALSPGAQGARARRRPTNGRDASRRGGSREGAGVARAGVAACALAFSIVLLLAPAARAHGPTVEITEAGLKPPLLNLFVGTTVHFANTISAPEGLVIVDEGGTLASPRLRAPGDGWHYTFEQPGSHTIRIAERPQATMRIVIVPKRTP